MVKYENGRIYKIVCNVTGKQYVGSTTQPLSKRLEVHNRCYKRYQRGKKRYVTSFEILAGGDYEIVLIEEVKANNKEQLHRRERYWIEQLECVNKFVPTRNKQEYYQDNREEIREKQAQYNQENRERINQQKAQYYQENRERIIQRKAQFYQDNREKINEKHVCKCGGRYTTKNKTIHEKSIKHRAYLEKLASPKDPA